MQAGSVRGDVERRRLVVPAGVLGFGLGAFFDGIVLHQVLQWHHLVSSRVSPGTVEGLERNTLADGLFHAASWVLVVVGLVWLVQRRRTSPRTSGRVLAGAALVGWGAFHVVDQVLFHLLLQAHHIRPGEHTQLYDWAYTAIGVLMALVGRALLARGRS